MNFIRCRVEQNGVGLRARLSDRISLPIPQAQTSRFQGLTGKELIFGLRPEHITEPRRSDRDQECQFDTTLDVVEPMGMETLVYFRVNGDEVCARVDPSAAAESGRPIKLTADLSHLHLIDPATDLVL